MPKPKTPLLFLCLLVSCFTSSKAQDSATTTSLLQQPDKVYTQLASKASSVENNLDKATIKYLAKLQKQEVKLRSKLFKKDSSLAHQVFDGVDEKYNALKNSTQKLSGTSSVYSGHLDSLTTSLKFLQNNPLTAKADVGKSLLRLGSLQDKLNQTETIKKFIQERKNLLKANLEKLGMLKELKGFQKQAYYYTQKLNEIKSLWEEPGKLEKRILEELVKLPAFQDFFRQNSMLGSLFALPGGSNSNATASLAGLQTRASVQAAITQRFGTGAGLQQIQQNVAAAQGQLSELKNKLASLGNGSYGNSNGEINMPEGFKPSTVKTKTFLQRLVLGTDIQSQKSRTFFPVTTDLSLLIGYRLAENGTVGIGAAYKIGLGQGWDKIRLSNEGLGLRTYIDWRLKGSIYLSGGYEQNYRTAFRNVQQLRDYSSWQSSGLLGLAKKYKLSGKIKGEMKLLWDFLSQQQMPRTQSILFRIGYSLK